ncbi:branchpoint-bridging protein-like [Vicia villosa]|uniref:branchpoint-bridging protein-like n=1 Tax=Vicia villosa TaxID=3911 RepID=UPI00273AE4AA|nr:branchpoint-bridging protein-like [Vicia villosa]
MMFDLRNPEGVFETDQKADWDAVLAKLYTDVKKTKRVRDMKNLYIVWTKILLGCFYHRKATHSPDFVNKEQQYILSELPEVRTKYLNSLKEDKAKDVPAKVSRKKASTSRPAVSEVALESAQEVVVNKERRTKRKFDRSSVNHEKEVQEEVVAVVDENAAEREVIAEDNQEVLVENKNTKQEESVPIEVPVNPQPEILPETAPTESPQLTHVLTPPSSPQTNVLTPPSVPTTNALIPPSPPTNNVAFDHPLETLILDIQPLQTLFPPHLNISTSQPPPHANHKPIPSPTQNNPSISDLPNSVSHEKLLRDCNYTPKPRPEPEFVVLDSENEA